MIEDQELEFHRKANADKSLCANGFHDFYIYEGPTDYVSQYGYTGRGIIRVCKKCPLEIRTEL